MSALLAAAAVVLAGVALHRGHRRAVAPAAPSPPPRRQHRRVDLRDYPDALDLIVLAVRAGHLPAGAVRASLPHLPDGVRAAFVVLVQRLDGGERFADALSVLPAMLGPVAEPLADRFAAADRYGLPLAPVLERLADDARQQRRRRIDTLARQLPVRLALPLVLCTLPSFVLLAVVPLLLAALTSLHR